VRGRVIGEEGIGVGGEIEVAIRWGDGMSGREERGRKEQIRKGIKGECESGRQHEQRE
jgi:hypothetical protein